jgi:hypothetical protein
MVFVTFEETYGRGLIFLKVPFCKEYSELTPWGVKSALVKTLRIQPPPKIAVFILPCSKITRFLIQELNRYGLKPLLIELTNSNLQFYVIKNGKIQSISEKAAYHEISKNL